MSRLRIRLLLLGTLLLGTLMLLTQRVDDGRLVEWARATAGLAARPVAPRVADAPARAAERASHSDVATMPAESASTTDPVAEDTTAVTRPASTPALTLSQARERVLRGMRERDCEQATYAMSERSQAAIERYSWRWLPPEQVAVERLARNAAAARMAEGCPPLADTPTARNQRQLLRERALAAAQAAGDPEAQLRAWNNGPRESTPAQLAQLRALLYDALLSGDPERIAGIARHERTLDPDAWRRDPAAFFLHTAWQLVACDLGRDCGPTSPALDRMCLYESSGSCGAASVEDALRFTTNPAIFERIQQRRQELLDRIRNGRISGMFDPPAQVPDGRGP